MTRVLVTGAGGQIGTELSAALRERYGLDQVLVTDIRDPADWASEGENGGRSAQLDCLDESAIEEAFASFRPNLVFHLAAILSARGEHNPRKAYDVNVGSLLQVLDAAVRHEARVFVPSSIAAFGPETPGDPTPQRTIQRPKTMYGITKVCGELLCDYYHLRHGLDVRGLRFPGLISYTAPPGGGTTDYAVEIFHEALSHGHYTCFLTADTQLDMMYIDDAVRAAIELMEAPAEALRDRNGFNVTAMQFTPAELGSAIQDRIPGFTMDYDADPMRQRIADSWPRRLDDSEARSQWGWKPEYGIEEMVSTMLEGLSGSATPPSKSGTKG
ncbi:MAG: NAD-dependent epimerase/dehydratase family protein [Longimicrobiales bacterium]